MNICILSLPCFNLLSSDAGLTHIGGAEVQIVTLARGLLRQGHRVSFVTLDHGQPDGMEVGGLRIFKAFAPNAGLPGLRFFWPRLTSVRAALSRADPEVCIQPAADCWTGIAARWCRGAGRRFVFVSMSEADCDARLPFLHTRRDRILYRHGLRRADSVVVQTEVQRRMMRENFGIRSVVVRPCCQEPEADDCPLAPEAQAGLLWIGRYSPEKRLDWFLDIAQACPNWLFHVVGKANDSSEYAKDLQARAASLSNVIEHGFVPHQEIGALYRKSRLLVTTSEIEGFPTTFMEAWARGIPTVATVDPDRLIAEHGLGAVADDVPGLIREIRSLLDNEDTWTVQSRNARSFFQQNHSVDAGASSYSQLLTALGDGNGSCIHQA